MHRFEVRVRYGDVDPMGWVYYANYLRWFEIGRAEMMRSLGHSYREVEDNGVRLPVVEARCQYVEGARYDELVAIETGVEDLRRASVRFAYRITRASDGALLASGATVHCFLGSDGRPTRPPEELLQVLKRAPKADVAAES